MRSRASQLPGRVEFAGSLERARGSGLFHRGTAALADIRRDRRRPGLNLPAKLRKVGGPPVFQDVERPGVDGFPAGLEQSPDLGDFTRGIGSGCRQPYQGGGKNEVDGLTFHDGTMAATVRGIKTDSIPQPDETGVVDRYGVHSLTRVELVPRDDFSRLLRALYTQHPQFPAMAVSRVSWDKPKSYAGQFYRVSYIYEGFINSLPEPTYELSGTLTEEPIETHPDFATFAGTPSAPENGAVFLDPETNKPTTDDDLGVFSEFGATGSKAGVASYVSPGALWTQIYFSVTKPSGFGDLGEIDSPEGGPPSAGGRDWLLWDFSYRRRGHVYEVRKTWKLSGRNGWDADIY